MNPMALSLNFDSRSAILHRRDEAELLFRKVLGRAARALDFRLRAGVSGLGFQG